MKRDPEQKQIQNSESGRNKFIYPCVHTYADNSIITKLHAF